VWGKDPPWAVATPTHLPQERGGDVIICGVCVSVPGGGENVWCLVGAGDVQDVVTDC
jgi:hypothetical protein